jgi:cytochrome b6-f complex iron-sulfur subunit
MRERTPSQEKEDVRLRLIRREVLYYILFAALLLFSALIVALTYWVLSPRGDTIRLDRAAYPPAHTPYEVRLDDISFWLVNLDGHVIAFDAFTPGVPPRARTRPCMYTWSVANGRFEDPCFGAKFTLDGSYIEGPALRSLDRYAVRVTEDTLRIDVTDVIPGAPITPVPIR